MPIVFYIHGGGWTRGSILGYAATCQRLVHRIGSAILVSVDYRLGPEYQHPYQSNDCYDVILTLLENPKLISPYADGTRVSFGGDSAGGNLALATVLKLIQDGFDYTRFKSIYPIYPSVDLVRMDRPSYEKYGKKHCLTEVMVKRFRGYYVGDDNVDTETLSDWVLSPLYAPDVLLEKLPRTLVTIAEMDVLASECEEFAQKIHDLGVDTTVYEVKGTIHGFISKPFMDEYKDHTLPAIDYIADFIRDAF